MTTETRFEITPAGLIERCQTPTAVTCGEPAEFRLDLPDPGLNMPPASLVVCAFHADELRRDCAAVVAQAPAPDCAAPADVNDVPTWHVVTIPDTCPPQAVGPFTDAELNSWAIGEAVRIYQAGWDAHPEEKPARWNAQTALVNLIGDGYTVAELRRPE